jgi:hypothetical protein
LPVMDAIASTSNRAAEPDRTVTDTKVDKGLQIDVVSDAAWYGRFITHVSHPASRKSCGITAMDGPVSAETIRATPPTNFMVPGMPNGRR